ncbi:hypothetical protein FEM48_Zijuj03G0033400 [Ziziphus jujuba var. spinosa]|uniref:C2 NT-type domain-containing protein n=1 Tax=Ziziphus jujuba var. spinosa TaxID=714518 RepID=A0A978VMV9_ZIZJJ|nr:hypothetical protein FEM48_Zijuj03G0033400 [Ziziphus jujuba var. spinosa]
MVVKMIRWPPWPPLLSKKFEVRILVKRLKGLDIGGEFEGERKVGVELKWKGQKGMGLGSLRRSVKRNFTKESDVSDDGVVEWDEEFQSLCNFSGPKEGLFYPWDLTFTVFTVRKLGLKSRASVLGTASLNLADHASLTEQKELEFNIPLNVPGFTSENSSSLSLCLSMMEWKTGQGLSETVQGLISTSPSPLSSPLPSPCFLSPRYSDAIPSDKDEFSALKAGLRKVKTFKEFVSGRKVKTKRCEEEGSDGRASIRSDDGACHYPCDTDSLDNDAEGELEESKEDFGVRHSVSYETLALANCARGSFYSNANINDEDECWVYYSNRKSDVGCSPLENSSSMVSAQILQQGSKRKILSWKKRKLSFRSPKAKGEPLLKKHYGEDGGDDIDFDRRQLSSSDESSFGWNSMTGGSSVSEFGDDNFAVGSWESREVTSRDGHLKLQTQVFFASIDQRSERAAGESACTALVAVIANWLQSNPDEMPIKSEFDGLIRDGSSEWRNLCENEVYIERFPDKHFDLDTVLQSKIRPLDVVPEKSFIGFFRPEGLEEGELDFLHGAMSFDSIWDEISHSASHSLSNDQSPLIYIISWNDHFFVLKVEQDAYYIVDTLGERLYEGCNQAYVLKFDKDTVIRSLPNESQTSDEKPATTTPKGQVNNSKETKAEETLSVSQSESENKDKEEVVVCKGKESCKEYIKSFLAAIPIRELQVDLKKGLMASTPIHHRLQIEFHYTEFLQPMSEYSMKELTAEAPATMEMALAVA